MTNMFRLFDNLSDDYIPNNRPKKRPPKPVVNNTISLSNLWPLLNAKEEIIGAEWNHGDAFYLPFEIRGNIADDNGDLLDLEEYFTGKTLTIDFLDHFYNEYSSYEKEASVVVEDDAIVLIFEFDKETSKEIARGTYHPRLTVDDYIIYSPLDAVLHVR